MNLRSAVMGMVLFLTGTGAAGQSEPLQALLAAEGFENAAIGLSVKRVNDGCPVVEYLPEMSLTPASVLKLLPTAMALYEKGANYTYRTDIFYTGDIRDGVLYGDIVVKGVGDPCPESRYFPAYLLFAPLTNAIREAGIREVAGAVRVEGNMADPEVPGGWVWEDISNYYAALCHPFNYRDNTYVLDFCSGVAGTNAVMKSVEPVLPGITIRNYVKAAANNRDNAWIFGGPNSRDFYVKGTIPQNRSSFKVKGAVHDPAFLFENELTGKLREGGIEVNGKHFGAVGEKVLLTLTSPSLKEIVYHTNKSSVNLFAEALGRLAGSDDFATAAADFCKKNGLDAAGLILKDACGLSPLDAAPARFFTDLLIWAQRNVGEPFVASLPLGGKDGGLNGYCAASPLLKNSIRAKTGSMAGVRCLSGYLTARNGDRLAFTILVNHYTCTSLQLQQAVGKFLALLL